MSDRIPFPMPEPQRAAAVAIIVAVARAAKVPPCYLTAHIQDSTASDAVAVYDARREAQRRILAEVPGCSRGMLAFAFRRDLRRMRASELS